MKGESSFLTPPQKKNERIRPEKGPLKKKKNIFQIQILQGDMLVFRGVYP